MADPKRWLEGGDDASELERSLLRRARDASAASRGATPDKAVIWAALAAHLPPGGLAPAPPSATTAPAAAKGGLLQMTAGAKVLATKGAIVLAVAGSTIVMGVQLAPKSAVAPPPAQKPAGLVEPAATSASTSAEPPTTVALPVHSAPLVAPTAARLLDEPRVVKTGSKRRPADVPGSCTRPPASTPAVEISTVSALREEAAMVADARNKLRGGDADGALAALDTALRRFPNGTLAEERDALRVEALARCGDRAAAAAAAATFVRAHPNSPHLDHVRSFL